jgi:hypothetical protein
LLFDLEKQGLSDKEVSVVLLEPQSFKLSPEEARASALENGLESTRGSCAVNLVFGPATDNRFAWDVTNPDITPTAEVPEPIFRVVLDVEGGKVYAIEKIVPGIAH